VAPDAVVGIHHGSTEDTEVARTIRLVWFDGDAP
jgi:hypothetical protein